MAHKRSRFTGTIHIFFGTILVLAAVIVIYQYTTVKAQKERYTYLATNQVQNIVNNMDRVLTRAGTLSTLIMSTSGNLDFFDFIAPELYTSVEKDTGIHLKNLGIAPDGIVSNVYPMSGNESLLGFNFMDSSRPGNLDAIEAYQNGKSVVTNPFPLIQGGTGIAIRSPVYIYQDNIRILWGLVTVTMDYNQFVETLNLENLDHMGLNWELWYEDLDGGRVSMKSSEKNPEKPVSVPITLYNLSWHLDVAPKDGWNKSIIILIVSIVSVGVAFLMAHLHYTQKLLKLSNIQLGIIAERDALTNCYSRHYVNNRLIDQRNGCWQDKTVKYSMAIFDVDKFKEINDKFGHEAGDRSLVAIVQVLTPYLNEDNGDCLIRFGGDEFIVLWNNISEAKIQEKLEKIINDVRNIHFPDSEELKLTVSIGVSMFNNSEESLYYNMLKLADEKLYLSKENGRDQYTM